MSESAHSSSVKAISPREHIMGILALIFFATVLFSRFALPPKSWRRLDSSTTMEELRVKLGEPFAAEVGGTVWREEALLGYWELTVRPESESGRSFRNHFRFYGKAQNRIVFQSVETPSKQHLLAKNNWRNR